MISYFWFLQDRRHLHQCEKGPTVWQDPAATLEHEVPEDSRERAEDTSIWGRNAEGEALRSIISKLSEERNLRDLHLKHYKRTTRLKIPGKIVTSIYTW